VAFAVSSGSVLFNPFEFLWPFQATSLEALQVCVWWLGERSNLSVGRLRMTCHDLPFEWMIKQLDLPKDPKWIQMVLLIVGPTISMELLQSKTRTNFLLFDIHSYGEHPNDE